MEPPEKETVTTEQIEIVVNGKPRAVSGGQSLDQLLGALEIDPSRVAIERNRSIVRKADWAATQVEAGDLLEIVWFVGGG